ncbi:MAG: MFS transporter, partial [Gemmobacter sp.]
HIHSDNEADTGNEKPISWGTLFRVRQTYVFIIGKLLTDPIWWFFLFWLPSYFSTSFNLDLKKPGWPLVIIYMATSIGSIGGGYLSSYFIQKGWPVFKARKTAMFIFALCVLPIMSAKYATNMWVAVALISLAAAAHQAWSGHTAGGSAHCAGRARQSDLGTAPGIAPRQGLRGAPHRCGRVG